MCEPISGGAAAAYIAAAIAAAGTAYSMHQSDQAAKDRNKAVQEQYDAENARAARDAKDSQNKLVAQAEQLGDQYSDSKRKLAIEKAQAASAARVASAESGVGGVSAIRSFIASEVQADVARSDIEKENRYNQFGLEQTARGIGNTRSDQLQNNKFSFLANARKRASGMDYVVGVGSSAATAYIDAGGLKKKKEGEE
jgi:cell division protein FtsL